MTISTRGRYAIRVMVELAKNTDGGYVALKTIADQQGLSLKYIPAIMPVLSKHKLIDGTRGKGGGYRLSKHASEYKIGDILRLTEGNLAPVSCLECDAPVCSRADICPTLPMWRKFHKMINEFFDGVTLEDLMKKENFQ